jgi:predicted nucleic acid-binding protein
MSKTLVLDACALIAYFNDELGAEIVHDSLSGNSEVFVAAVNVYEVVYDAYRTTGGETSAKKVLDVMNQLRCSIVWDLSPELMLEAAKFKHAYKVSLADSIALGLSKRLQARLVTCDHHEFDEIDTAEGAEFLWIR